MWKLVGGHLVALLGAAAVLIVTFGLLLTNIDPYASHTDVESARIGAALVLALYAAFAAGVHGLRRALERRQIPMPASIYTWAVLVLPPVAIVAVMGLSSTY